MSTRRVLCVSADPDLQRMFIRALALPGFAVECVLDADEALERFGDDPREYVMLVTDASQEGGADPLLVPALRARGFHGTVLVTGRAGAQRGP